MTADTFNDFFQRHLRLVFAIAQTIAASLPLAEDLTQETLLRAWQHRNQVLSLPLPAQRAWLLTTLRRLAVDRVRKEKPERQEDWEGRGETRAEGDSSSNTLLRLDVLNALATLSLQDREIVMLRYFEELSSREIGEILGMPEGSVRRRLAVSRGKLAEQLGQWDTDRPDAMERNYERRNIKHSATAGS